jgi:hypothetical protein
MCDGVSAVMAIAAAAGVVTTLVKGAEEQRSLDFQATQADKNAATLEAAAGDARLRGNVEAQQTLLAGGLMRGEQRAALGTSGVSYRSSQVANIQGSSDAMAAQDADTVLSNAFREAWGMGRQAAGLRAQADANRAGKAGVAAATYLGAAGQAAEGFGSVYRSAKGLDYQQPAKPATLNRGVPTR